MIRFTLRRGLAATVAFIAFSGLAAASAQQPPLRIGVIYSYTGAPPLSGKLFDAGIDLYMKQHGDAVAGRKIEVIRRDDTGLAPDVARRVATELIVQDHVDVLLGLLLTPNAVAVESVSAAAKKQVLIVNAASSHILERDPYAVRFGYSMPQLTQPLAQWAASNHIKTAFILYQNYGPGVDASTAFTRSFTATGGTILDTVAFPVGTLDFSAYVQRIKDAKPQAVYAFINGGGGSGPLFVRAADAAGFKKAGITILAANDLIAVNELNLASNFSVDLIQAMDYTPSHPTAVNRAFVKSFDTLNTQLVPDFLAVATYDAMAAIYKAAAAQNGNLDPDKTMELFAGMKFESPRGPIAIDPKTRDIIENIYVRRVASHDGAVKMTEIQTFPMVRDPTEE